MSKGSTQRPTDMDRFSSNWDNIFRKKEAMITIPAQHNTKNPPGQVRFPVGETSPVGAPSPTQQGKPTRQEIEDFLAEKSIKPDNNKHGY